MLYFFRISVLAFLLVSNTCLAAGDPAKGAALFRACVACHSIEPDEHLTGPSLANLWNRKAGTATGFQRYSEALKRSGVIWNETSLDKWLSGPETFLPGTSMTFAGISGVADRQALIAYLKAVSENKAPKLEQRGGMMMRNARIDLRKAPAEGRVRAITQCGDTYTVSTADGKSQKVWEFNLRFKTDSSRLGPQPGIPVIVGAGMQGDRASVVFASPGEISGFVKRSCE